MKKLLATLFTLIGVGGCSKEHATDIAASPVKPPDNRTVVEFSPAAAQELKKRFKDLPVSVVRVSVSTEGPNGFMYNMVGQEQVDADQDYLSTSQGIRTAVDKKSAALLEGTVIDWRTTPDGRTGFYFDNPNVEE